MILEDLYRGKYTPIESMAVHNDHDRLTQLQEEIVAALPEDKKELVDATQDALMEMVIDESEAAFVEGVRFGIRLITEVNHCHQDQKNQGKKSRMQKSDTGKPATLVCTALDIRFLFW